VGRAEGLSSPQGKRSRSRVGEKGGRGWGLAQLDGYTQGRQGESQGRIKGLTSWGGNTWARDGASHSASGPDLFLLAGLRVHPSPAPQPLSFKQTLWGALVPTSSFSGWDGGAPESSPTGTGSSGSAGEVAGAGEPPRKLALHPWCPPSRSSGYEVRRRPAPALLAATQRGRVVLSPGQRGGRTGRLQPTSSFSGWAQGSVYRRKAPLAVQAVRRWVGVPVLLELWRREREGAWSPWSPRLCSQGGRRAHRRQAHFCLYYRCRRDRSE